MRKYFVILAIFLSVFCCTSCFEFTQSISVEGEDYHIKRKMSFSKYFLAMTMSGDKESSESLSLQEFETEFDKLAESMGAEAFHTPAESGVVSHLTINKNTKDKDALANLPQQNGTKIIIPIIDMTEMAEKAQADWNSLSMAYMLLATAKYQLTLEKDVVPYISSAYLLEQDSNEQIDVDVVDTGENFLIDIPVLSLFEHSASISPLIIETDPNKATATTKVPPPRSFPSESLADNSTESMTLPIQPVVTAESTHSAEETEESFPRKGKAGNGPFGLEQGMSYEDLLAINGDIQLNHIDDDRYWIVPPKKHPSFERYIVWISQDNGLYYIKAMGKTMEASDYGTELKREFHNVLTPLEKKYGRFTLIDTIAPDFTLSSEQYWMSALRNGARTYQAYWKAPGNKPEDNGITEIWLGIEPKNSYSDEGYIWIEYKFHNTAAAQESFDDIL